MVEILSNAVTIISTSASLYTVRMSRQTRSCSILVNIGGVLSRNLAANARAGIFFAWITTSLVGILSPGSEPPPISEKPPVIVTFRQSLAGALSLDATLTSFVNGFQRRHNHLQDGYFAYGVVSIQIEPQRCLHRRYGQFPNAKRA